MRGALRRLSRRLTSVGSRLSAESPTTELHQQTPTRAPLPEWHSAEQHARRLYQWLAQRGHTNGTVLASDLVAMYREMTTEAGWLPRAWAPVARQYCLLTAGGAKRYLWVGKRLSNFIGNRKGEPERKRGCSEPCVANTPRT
jgi:hypothetical protein